MEVAPASLSDAGIDWAAEQFQALVGQEAEVEKLVKELEECDEVTSQQSLFSMVKVLLGRLVVDLEHVEDLLGVEDRETLSQPGAVEDSSLALLKEHIVKVESLRKASRKASLVSQQRIEKMARSSRAELLQGDEEALKKRRAKQQEGALRSARATTEALTRTKARLEFELERSGHTLETLNESATVIKATLDEHHVFSETTSQASYWQDKLKDRQFVDMLLIGAGTLLYCSVLFYVLQARLLWFL